MTLKPGDKLTFEPSQTPWGYMYERTKMEVIYVQEAYVQTFHNDAGVQSHTMRWNVTDLGEGRYQFEPRSQTWGDAVVRIARKVDG